MILLDTDVMIDVLRGYDPALAWLKSLGAEPVGLPGLVAPLATFNDKHYRVIGGLQLLEPYSRFP